MCETIAIIVAAGLGSRFHSEIPKQYKLFYNKPILYYSLSTFLNHSLIDAVVPVINENHISIFKNLLQNYNLKNHKKLLPFVLGGRERQDSVSNALQEIKKISKVKKILIHDGARPLVSNNLISQIVNNTTNNCGCTPILPIYDTIKQLDNNYIVQEISRNKTVRVQTPQGFPFEKFLKAQKLLSCTKVTDDTSIFSMNNLKVTTVLGHPLNEKITTQEQLFSLEKLTGKSEFRTGQGFDIHPFDKNKDLLLGGLKIPHHLGLKGHSDADVVIHAIVDAMLGSIAEGDIGDHFPPSNNKWKNASSKIFLLKAKKLLEQKNANIVNLDITILCEEPKLGIYKKSIAENIATLLEISTNKVSVKATTTEKLGFIGRKEGIATLVNILIKVDEFNYNLLHY